MRSFVLQRTLDVTKCKRLAREWKTFTPSLINSSKKICNSAREDGGMRYPHIGYRIPDVPDFSFNTEAHGRGAAVSLNSSTYLRVTIAQMRLK